MAGLNILCGIIMLNNILFLTFMRFNVVFVRRCAHIQRAAGLGTSILTNDLFVEEWRCVYKDKGCVDRQA